MVASDSQLHHADWLRGLLLRMSSWGVGFHWWLVGLIPPSSGSGRLEGFGGSKHRPHFGHQILSDFGLNRGDYGRRHSPIFLLRCTPWLPQAGGGASRGRASCGWWERGGEGGACGLRPSSWGLEGGLSLLSRGPRARYDHLYTLHNRFMWIT